MSTTTEPRAIPRTKPNVNDRYRADVTTPLPETVGAVPLDTIPDPPADNAKDAQPAKPVIILSTTIVYRGRIITLTNDGMTLNQFCDLLDLRFGVAE